MRKNCLQENTDIFFNLLGQQDRRISRFGKSSNDSFIEFSWGVFFLKKHLEKNYHNLPDDIKDEIRYRVSKQTESIEIHYNFLKRSLERAIH